MSEKDLNSKYTDLISRYLSGQTTESEVQELESWVLAAPENKAHFIDLKKAWMVSGMAGAPAEVDLDGTWKNLSDTVFTPEKIVGLKPRRVGRRWIGIAAGIAAAALVGASLLLFPFGRKGQQIAAANKAEFIELPDGSKVNLNQSSRMAYDIAADRGVRKVVLEGDAFFNVARNEAQPFVVSAGEIEIEVLGTAFYVDSRDDLPQIQVIVESGSVAVRAGREEIILESGQMATFLKSEGQLIGEQSTNDNYKSFITRKLVFSGTPLREVIFTLNRHFQSSIILGNPALADCSLVATYEQKSLEAILILIEASLVGVKANRMEDGSIVLSGERCE